MQFGFIFVQGNFDHELNQRRISDILTRKLLVRWCLLPSSCELASAICKLGLNLLQSKQLAFPLPYVIMGSLLLQAVVAAANFERRCGDREGAAGVYEDLIREETSKEDSSSVLPFLSLQYAHFLRQVGARQTAIVMYVVVGDCELPQLPALAPTMHIASIAQCSEAGCLL